MFHKLAENLKNRIIERAHKLILLLVYRKPKSLLNNEMECIIFSLILYESNEVLVYVLKNSLLLFTVYAKI